MSGPIRHYGAYQKTTRVIFRCNISSFRYVKYVTRDINMRLHILNGLFLGGTLALSAVEVKKTELNFSEHIAPIVFSNCTTCHRKGEATPFAFMNYNDVR